MKSVVRLYVSRTLESPRPRQVPSDPSLQCRKRVLDMCLVVGLSAHLEFCPHSSGVQQLLNGSKGPPHVGMVMHVCPRLSSDIRSQVARVSSVRPRMVNCEQMQGQPDLAHKALIDHWLEASVLLHMFMDMRA